MAEERLGGSVHLRDLYMPGKKLGKLKRESRKNGTLFPGRGGKRPEGNVSNNYREKTEKTAHSLKNKYGITTIKGTKSNISFKKEQLFRQEEWKQGRGTRSKKTKKKGERGQEFPTI